MRPIKFRALKKLHSKIGGGSWRYWTVFEKAPAHIVQETTGEFTGLLDKNGKEIYESDRIKHDIWGEFKIVWDDMSSAFRAVSDDEEKDLNLGHAQLQRCKVIGNAYES